MNTFKVPFSKEFNFPNVNSETCLYHRELMISFLEDPTYWYFLMGRAEFWDRTKLGAKRPEFYELYLGLVIGIFNLWSNGFVQVVKRDDRLYFSKAKSANETIPWLYENLILEQINVSEEILFDDILVSFLSPNKYLKQFFNLNKRRAFKDYDSLARTMDLLRWFLSIGEGMIKYEDVEEEDFANETHFVFIVHSLIMKTESFVLNQKWNWL